MLLEISIAQSDFVDMTLFHTIQEVIGRINIEKWIDFHRQRRDAYDPIALLTIILFAYARYGYASLRQLEEMSRYDLRCRLILQGQTPSYKAYQRFINHQLKGSIEELSHQVYLCIQNQKALEEAILMIDGTKFEANANKMTFYWGAWVKRYRPRHWQKAMEIVKQLNRCFKTQRIEVHYSILKEPTLKYLIEIDERLDQWLQEVGAIRKGRGIHPVAKLKRELGKVAKSLFSYALAKDILGERNSFSKTDPDATMMHMKYDYYNHTNVFKPGYNVQIGVNNGYIAYSQISPDVNDMKTAIPFLEGYRKQFGEYPKMVVTDAGYGSFGNYVYAQLHQIQAIMKYPGYQKKKEKVTEKNQFQLLHMKRTEEGVPICPEGYQFEAEKVTVDMKTGFPRTTIHYRNQHCEGCPMRSRCTTSKKGRSARVSPQLEKIQNQVDAVLETEEGRKFMAQRSSQAEGAFGDIKKNFGYSLLRRRGESGVKVELGLVILGYNLRHYHHQKGGKNAEVMK
ncbi:transposase [Holdemania massiliensis]|nr:transposase [Holdemania massiliensis]